MCPLSSVIKLYNNRAVNSMDIPGVTWNRLETYILEMFELLIGSKRLGKGLEIIEQRVL